MISQSQQLLKTIEKNNTLPDYIKEATNARLIALFPYAVFQPQYDAEMKELASLKHDKSEFLLKAVAILKRIYEEETKNNVKTKRNEIFTLLGEHSFPNFQIAIYAFLLNISYVKISSVKFSNHFF